MINKEYYDSHAKKCVLCGKIPNIVVETKKKDVFLVSNDEKDAIRIRCFKCGIGTGRCGSSESALKFWNKKMESMRINKGVFF